MRHQGLVSSLDARLFRESGFRVSGLRCVDCFALPRHIYILIYIYLQTVYVYIYIHTGVHRIQALAGSDFGLGYGV